MKTPYVGGRLPPKAQSPIYEQDLLERVRKMESECVQRTINQKNALRRLAEDYEERLEHEIRLRSAMVATHAIELQQQRWFMGFLCFLFLIAGIILGDALAPYDLR